MRKDDWLMTRVERQSVNRLSVAAYCCIGAALLLVLLLGGWGAFRDIKAVQKFALQEEVGEIRSHALRTVGRLERGLEDANSSPVSELLNDDTWLRQYWKRVIPREERRLYAAIVDSTGKVLMHSDPAIEGRLLERNWYERVVGEAGGDVFETKSDSLSAGRRSFDIRVPIDVGDREIAEYHAGFDVDWFQGFVAGRRAQILWRWTVVIGGILLVVALAGTSLYYIAHRSASMRGFLDMVQLQRVTELGQVAAGLAHEIRNPLHAIRLNLHALARTRNGRAKLAPDEVSAVIEQSNQEISRLDRLIEELLGFAKPEEARDERVDLTNALDATLSFVKQEMERKGITISGDLPREQVIVRVDPARLRQIMLNLLMNAKDAVDEGGRIEVSLVRRNGRVEINVSDNGPGVSTDDREHIFEPFYSTKDGGSGLGLALAKRFVDEAGGKISCEANASSSGTVFRVSLPAADAPK
jgi:signal transduction histidine kinase